MTESKNVDKPKDKDVDKIGKEFEKDSVILTILKFSIPSSIASIISLLCVLTDRYFIGQVAGRTGMSAIAIVYPYVVLINGLTFLFSGIGILVGIKLGEKNRRSAEKYLGVTMYWIFLFGFLLIMILYIFDHEFLKILGATSTNLEDAQQYTKYIIPSAIFQMILGQVALLRSIGQPNQAMLINIYAAVLNIILDYIFVMKLGYGISGAAFATLISTGVASSIFLNCIIKSDVLKLRFTNMKPDFKILKEVFKIGSPRLYNQVLQGMAMVATNRSAGIYGGEIATAAVGIISIVRTTINTSMQGFSQGTVAITSYYFGAKKYKKLKEVFKIQIIVVTVVTIVLVLLMMIFSENIVRFFVKNDPELIREASFGMRMNLFLMVSTAIFLACNNFMQSIKLSALSTRYFVIRVLLLNIGFIYLFGYLFGLKGVWLAFPLSETVSAFFIMRSVLKRIKKIG